MAREIYEIRLKNNLVPSTSASEALEAFNVQAGVDTLTEDETDIRVAVQEEHAVKLFVMAKTLYDTDKFEYEEIAGAIFSLAVSLGYYASASAVAECVTTWVERFYEMPNSDFQEWLLG